MQEIFQGEDALRGGAFELRELVRELVDFVDHAIMWGTCTGRSVQCWAAEARAGQVRPDDLKVDEVPAGRSLPSLRGELPAFVRPNRTAARRASPIGRRPATEEVAQQLGSI